MFLGLCSVFQRFVRSIALHAAPLSPKLRKDQPAIFVLLYENELKSMNSLKILLISPTVLVLHNTTGHMALNINACDVQRGYVLLLLQLEVTIEAIGYWSRPLTDADCKYDQAQQECLAIV